MKKIIFGFLIFNFSVLITWAQVQQKWVARYNGPGNGIDQAKSMAVDGSGNVYVTGESAGSGIGMDYATIKYNSSGVQQWVQRYNGPGNSYEFIGTIAVDASGNSFVTGGSFGIGTNFDVATIKYNTAGVQQWINRYNGNPQGNGNDIATAIAIDGSGNVYVTGSTFYVYDDVMTIKYNSSGVIQWVQKWNGKFFGDDYGYALAVDASGNVYVTGFSQGDGGGFNYITIKYSSSGVEQWFQEHSGTGSGDDYSLSIAVDASGNSYVSGFSSIPTGYNYVTIKYNPPGGQQWIQNYNGPVSGAYASSLTLDGSANVLVTGRSLGTTTNADYATVKYNPSGSQQWAARYNGPANNYDAASSVKIDASGSVYVTGESTGNGSQRDYATIKYNSSGIQQWIQRYNGPGNSVDYARSIAVDGLGNVYVTGESTGSGTGMDYATIKYSQGIKTVGNEITLENKLLENFPNPFNPVTVISYQLAGSNNVSLKIYDVLGNEVATLVNEKQNAGMYSVEWNASNFSSGVYFYKIATAEFIETKRMTLLK